LRSLDAGKVYLVMLGVILPSFSEHVLAGAIYVILEHEK
jgi:hypothetical protein